MMEIKEPKISFYMRRDYDRPFEFEIELEDARQSGKLFKVILDEKQFFLALSGLGYIKCKKAEVFNLDKINKKLEHKIFEFQIDEQDKNLARRLVKKLCPKGWTPDRYFNSRDSFFRKGKKLYARDIIRRWV